jgi:hypothetical protein
MYMKKKMKNIFMVMAVVAMAVMVSACGGDDEQPELYGNMGNNCNHMMNSYNMNGYQPYPNQGDFPGNGYVLQNQPNGLIYRNNLNGLCYNHNQFGNMWGQHGLPNNQFMGSPYANYFDVYNPYGQQSQGSTSYTSNVNYHSDWTNAGDFFNGGYPGGWGFQFKYQGK